MTMRGREVCLSTELPEMQEMQLGLMIKRNGTTFEGSNNLSNQEVESNQADVALLSSPKCLK